MKSTGTLAGGISRDFNNILTNIIGYTDLVPETLKIKHYLMYASVTHI